MKNFHPADGMFDGHANAGMTAIIFFLLFRQFRVWILFRFSRPFERQQYLGRLAIFFIGPLETEVEPQFPVEKPDRAGIENAFHERIIVDAAGDVRGNR